VIAATIRYERQILTGERAVGERLLLAPGRINYVIAHAVEQETDIKPRGRKVLEQRCRKRAVFAVAFLRDLACFRRIGDERGRT
jgi:hypothetical protein